MPSQPEPRTSPWIAFAAGAVTMLLAVLIWIAWDRAHEAATALRADVALSPGSRLPSLPVPPDGPNLPPLPSPGPR